MADTIRWGILSTARIGAKAVIPAIHKSRNGEVVAVASRNYDKAKTFADENNIPTAYGSYEDLLADESIDAIYISLPNSLHAEWAIKCAESGKPTLCEKPLASNTVEAQQMVAAFEHHNVLLAEAFMYRFHPQSQRALQMVREGAIGEVQLMTAAFSFPLSDETNIRLSADLAGGALMDVGCYCVNSMRFISGEEPIKGHAIAKFGGNGGVDERIVGTLEFPSGMLGHFDASLRSQRTHNYEVRGSTGRISLPESYTPDLTSGTVTHIIHEHGNQRDVIEIPAEDQYQLMAEDFADALLNDRPPRYPATDAVHNMRVIDMLLKSAQDNA